MNDVYFNSDKSKVCVCDKCNGLGLIRNMSHITHGVMETSQMIVCDKCNGYCVYIESKNNNLSFDSDNTL